MAGHSKWATTKHKKAALDAKRGKLFANLIKKIEVSARIGGADPGGNPTLYDAIQKAKKSSVPNDNIERAVKRGSGQEAGGADYQTIMYEGYGPGGIAVQPRQHLFGDTIGVALGSIVGRADHHRPPDEGRRPPAAATGRAERECGRRGLGRDRGVGALNRFVCVFHALLR